MLPSLRKTIRPRRLNYNNHDQVMAIMIDIALNLNAVNTFQTKVKTQCKMLFLIIRQY